jgi:gliding motility-associated-like protein
MEMRYLGIVLVLIFTGFYMKGKAQTIDTVCAFTAGRVYHVKYHPGSIYFWSVECGSIISTGNSDSVVVNWCSVPGIYKIRVVEKNNFGCFGDTVTARVVVQNSTKLIISGPKECCIGDSISLSVSGGSKFIWNTGETSSKITVRPKDSTRYSAIGYSSCSHKPDTVFATVKVYERPTASFTYDPKNPELNETIFFHYTGYGASDWTWYFGDRQSMGKVKDPKISFSAKGNKIVTLVARNEAGCLDTFTYLLHVGINSKIFVPSAFTPNANGKNDVFRAIGYNLQSIHMQIFNRWGELIYESYNMEEAWDGKFQGEPVMEGVYLYMIDATGIDGEQFYLHGPVTVLY